MIRERSSPVKLSDRINRLNQKENLTKIRPNQVIDSPESSLFSPLMTHHEHKSIYLYDLKDQNNEIDGSL
jgi:hypothetical protein